MSDMFRVFMIFRTFNEQGVVHGMLELGESNQLCRI